MPTDTTTGDQPASPPPPAAQASVPAIAERPKVPALPVEAGGSVIPLIPRDLDEFWRVAGAFSSAGMTPRGMTSQAQCMVVLMAGAELGLPPNQSMQSFYLVNNRPTIWGDAIPALLLSNGFKLKEWFENKASDYPDEMTAMCEITRPSGEVFEAEFSVADAKEAKLWLKDGPWQTSKKRMLKMRARSFCARDGAADVLKGFRIKEEEEDIDTPSERRAASTAQNATPAGLSERLKANASQEGFTASHAEIDPVDVAQRAAQVERVAEELTPVHDAEFEEGAPSQTENPTSPAENTATETAQDAEISPDSSASATDASPPTAEETSSPGAQEQPSSDGEAKVPVKSTSSTEPPGKVSGDLFADGKPAAKTPPKSVFDVIAWAQNIERNLPDYAGDGSLITMDFNIHADELREADPEYFKALRLKIGKRITELSQPKRPT